VGGFAHGPTGLTILGLSAGSGAGAAKLFLEKSVGPTLDAIGQGVVRLLTGAIDDLAGPGMRPIGNPKSVDRQSSIDNPSIANRQSALANPSTGTRQRHLPIDRRAQRGMRRRRPCPIADC
jgi:hypothetical protein